MPIRTQRSRMLTEYWQLLMEQGFPPDIVADMFDKYVKDLDRMFDYGDTKTLYRGRGIPNPYKKKRKLSAWQKYIKNKRNHITYRDGKLNLKAMGVQYRKKKRR